MSDVDERARYAAAWKDLARRFRLCWLLLLILLPLFGLAYYLNHGDVKSLFFLGPIVAWFICMEFATQWLGAFNCPRCGVGFHPTSSRYSAVLYARACANCQLPRNATPA